MFGKNVINFFVFEETSKFNSLNSKCSFSTAKTCIPGETFAKTNYPFSSDIELNSPSNLIVTFCKGACLAVNTIPLRLKDLTDIVT